MLRCLCLSHQALRMPALAVPSSQPCYNRTGNWTQSLLCKTSLHPDTKGLLNPENLLGRPARNLGNKGGSG